MTDQERQQVRAEVIRELDAKYNDICEKKVNAAIEEMNKRIKELEMINNYNADSIRRGLAKSMRLQNVVDAALYCYRNKYIDPTAVEFSGLAKALEDLENKNGTGPHY